MKLLCSILVVASHYLPHFLNIQFYTFATAGFFLLSGYYSFNFETQKGFKYFLNRLLKLSLLYYVSILCYILIKIRIADDGFSQILIHHFTYFLAAKDPAIFFRLNPAFWSMPVFLVFFFLKSFLNLKARLLYVLLFLFLSQLSNINQFNVLDTFGTPISAMIKFLWIFLLGGWIGNQEECKPLKRPAISIPILLITLIAVAYMGVYYQSAQIFFKFKNNFHVDQEAIMGLVFGFFLYCLQYSPFSKLNIPFLSTYGKMSFAVYLLHNLMVLLIDRELGALGLILSLTITIVISALFTFGLERPFLRKFK